MKIPHPTIHINKCVIHYFRELHFLAALRFNPLINTCGAYAGPLFGAMRCAFFLAAKLSISLSAYLSFHSQATPSNILSC